MASSANTYASSKPIATRRAKPSTARSSIIGRKDLLAAHLDLTKLQCLLHGEQERFRQTRGHRGDRSVELGARCWLFVRYGVNSASTPCSINASGASGGTWWG